MTPATLRRAQLALVALCSMPTVASAQIPGSDTSTVARPPAAESVTVDPRWQWRRWRRAGVTLHTGKTYNRVEGLPLRIGGFFRDTLGAFPVSITALGILRSADEFRWDSGNLGHDATAELRSQGDRYFRVSVSLYDLVSPVEDWQMGPGEAGLASFLFHRDYRDHFGRHGGRVALSLHAGEGTGFELSWSDERWSRRDTRQVLTLWRNNHAWRPNPALDDAAIRVLDLKLTLDTRNDPRGPWSGWLLRSHYERGTGEMRSAAPASPAARGVAPSRIEYGRLLVDARRYNTLWPGTQLNARVVAGGWVHGGELPLQRRLSVGGAATVPGFDFRESALGDDVQQCATTPVPAGAPAQCERLVLMQLEFRDELPHLPGTIFGGTPIRIRSAAFTLRPTLVAFADAGRGWLVPPRDAGAGAASSVPGLTYGTGRIPPLRTFRADVGVGVDLGLFGIYAAKAVSDAGAMNVFLRVRARF